MLRFSRFLVLVLTVALGAAFVPAASAAAAKKPKPNVVAIAAKPAAATQLPTARFTWKVTPKKTPAQCVLDKGKWKACTTKIAYAKLKDGPHTFQVRVRRSGRTGPWVTRKYTWRVDRVAPTGAAVSYAGGPSAATAVAATFSGGDDGKLGSGVASVRLEQSSGSFTGACGAYGSFGTVATASPATVALADGACTQLRVVATDTAGNVATSAPGPVISIERSDLVLAGSPATATEGGAAGAPTIALSSAPAAAVTVTSTLGGSGATLATTSRTFTAANWSTPQSFPIVATDDAVDEASPVVQGVTFVASSSDANWNGEAAAGSVSVVDNDVAGITVIPPAAQVLSEANPLTVQTFSVVLTSEPTGPVTITLGAAQVVATPSSLNFTAATWSTPQVVSVRGLADDVDEANPHTGTVTFVVASSDGAYAGRVVVPVVASITDDDTAGLTVAITSGTATEGGADAGITVRLDSQPTRSVTLNLTTSVPARLVAAPTSVTFTTANWNVSQPVALQAVDDLVQQAPSVNAVVTATGAAAGEPHYHLLATTRNVSLVDDDAAAAGVEIVPSGATATFSMAGPWPLHEDQSVAQTFDVRLTAPPTSGDHVNIDVIPLEDIAFQFQASGSGRLQFHDGNWDDWQTVTITALQDMVAEAGVHPGSIGFDASQSGDPTYASVTISTVYDFDITDMP
ncbi:MAG: hypothetical protein JWM90_798 [Thermoleophilia bacterium]|nr:hypothetical protein [Thermoleophilia bacterium]